MEITTAKLCGVLVTTAGISLYTWYLGYFLTEWRAPLFNFKPFNCRPCLTFWLTFFIHFVIYFAATPLDWWFALATSLVPAFVSFLMLKNKYTIL